MTNQQILTKAIQKAIDGGFDLKKWPSNNVRYWPDYLSEHALIEHVARTVNDMRLEHLIFNHDFAKALWKQNDRCLTCGSRPTKHSSKHPDHTYISDRCWQYHLQQMVISEDPIKYLATTL